MTEKPPKNDEFKRAASELPDQVIDSVLNEAIKLIDTLSGSIDLGSDEANIDSITSATIQKIAVIVGLEDGQETLEEINPNASEQTDNKKLNVCASTCSLLLKISSIDEELKALFTEFNTHPKLQKIYRQTVFAGDFSDASEKVKKIKARLEEMKRVTESISPEPPEQR